MWVAGAGAHKAFSGPFHLLRKGEHIWSWFPAAETTSTAPVPREQLAAQNFLGPKASRDLGEKPESTAFLSKHALGLSLVS